jgi:hypothetical protein
VAQVFDLRGGIVAIIAKSTYFFHWHPRAVFLLQKIIRMLFKDNVQHHKPHVHVQCGEHNASVGIDGELLAGSLPKKKYTILNAWLIIHEEELYEAWNNAVRNIEFDIIEPLR